MKRLFALVVAAVSFAVGAPAAWATPADGASQDTAGTSATVSPRTLAAGATISFTLRGFPAGQTVNVKIDDGHLCTDTSHGACVYLQQKIPASGTVSGSLTLPHTLAAGAHWLRFLASAPAPNGNGTIGYTCRGNSDFTVVGAGAPATTAAGRATVTTTASAGSSSGTSTAAATATTAAPRPSGAEPAAAAGQLVTATPSERPSTPSSSAPSASSASSSESAESSAAAVTRSHTSGGAIGLTIAVLVAVALAAGAAAWGVVRRWT